MKAALLSQEKSWNNCLAILKIFMSKLSGSAQGTTTAISKHFNRSRIRIANEFYDELVKNDNRTSRSVNEELPPNDLSTLEAQANSTAEKCSEEDENIKLVIKLVHERFDSRDQYFEELKDVNKYLDGKLL